MGSNVFRRFSCLRTTTLSWHLILVTHDLMERAGTRSGKIEKKLFWDYVIPVEFLSFDANDTKEVNQAFDRLNRNMRKLDPQELRHARWEGWFISLVENECDDPTWRKLGIVTNARAKRMKDAQFISELLLVLIERKQMGFDQQRLDDAYATYDDPEESDLPIRPDDIKDQLVEAKQYLLDMQMANGCIKAYAGTLAVFYTLWAAVVLHRISLPEAAKFATIFANFREDASAIDSAGDKAGLLAGPHGEDFKLAYEFLQNSKGASRIWATHGDWKPFSNSPRAILTRHENPTVRPGLIR